MSKLTLVPPSRAARAAQKTKSRQSAERAGVMPVRWKNSAPRKYSGSKVPGAIVDDAEPRR
jgi:hypothetical protein